MTGRTRHLEHARGRVEVQLEDGIVLSAAPGYVIFLDRMQDGRWQTISVDPAYVESLIAGLRGALPVANTDPRSERVAS
jgi:hypothetical protein